MTPWGLLALVSTIWSIAASALPTNSQASSDNPDITPDHSGYGAVINNNNYDPLWVKYGLNKSEEWKYFSEPGNDDILGHYDARFFDRPVTDEQRSQTLTYMIRAYLDFFNENDLETWIAHGTLLGWWWNGRVMPWDWDIDTQVSDTTLARLADEFNQTVVHYETNDPDIPYTYLLDINPWSRQREPGLGLNIIDARWIDTQTGLYIDITGLSRLDPAHPNQWQCKHLHKYQLDDIYPLRETTFEGVTAKIPFRYDALLVEEYTEKALTSTSFHDHTWDPGREEWISNEAIAEDDEHQYE